MVTVCISHIIQIVHSTESQMALYGQVHKLPYGPKCHDWFVILYTTDQNYLNQNTIGCIIRTFLIQILKQSLKWHTLLYFLLSEFFETVIFCKSCSLNILNLSDNIFVCLWNAKPETKLVDFRVYTILDQPCSQTQIV